MLKKRLIFTLHFCNDFFMLSRNFKLQKVGDINWLFKSYNFKDIAFSIDELIVLNVARESNKFDSFSEHVKKISDTCFIPVAAGGNVRSEADAQLLLNSGADKIVLNSVLISCPRLVAKLISKFGSQCIVASVDFRQEGAKLTAYIEKGEKPVSMPLFDYLEYLHDLGVGEILIQSIDKDGTGQGFNIEAMREISRKVTLPLIIGGGAGRYQHFVEAFQELPIDAVSTANLFNFIGDGFPVARDKMLDNGISLAIWNRSEEKMLENCLKV